jgi:hypothetical protein
MTCLFERKASFFCFAFQCRARNAGQISPEGGQQIMSLLLTDVPDDVEVISLIIEKTLKSGMNVAVYLVKYPRHYEAAIFIDGHYKHGPPLPRPLETPTETAAYWMAVRPKVGLSQEEGDEILGTVNVQNKMHHCQFIDKWGTAEDY